MPRDPEPPAREIPASSLQPPPSSRRGGRRPGAGAPKGNLNALRSGTRSKQLRAVIVALLTVPEPRRVLLHFSRMEQRKLAQLQMAISRYAWLARPRRRRSRQGMTTVAPDPRPSVVPPGQ